MLAQRFVSLITRSISSASALPGGSLSRIRCEKVSTPVSGLFEPASDTRCEEPDRRELLTFNDSLLAASSCCVLSSTFCSSVRAASRSSVCESRSAFVIVLNDAATWPNSSALRTGMGSSRLPAGQFFGARFEIAQRHIHEPVHKQPDTERRIRTNPSE